MEWFDKTINKFRNQPMPLRLTIELTSACNFNCIHCYHANHNISNELTFDEIICVVKQFKALGLFQVTLTGGEPLLHKDFSRLIDALTALHLKIDVYSNASLINEQNIHILKKPNVSTVQISIYGATEQTYNTVTRSSGNYRKYCAALELLHLHKINTRASIILLQANYQELNQMTELCQQYNFEIQYGIEMLSDRNDKTKKHVEITSEQKFEFIKKRIENDDWSISGECHDEDSRFLCTAGIKGYNLTSIGEITPCTGYYRPIGNIRANTVKEILSNKIADEIRTTNIGNIKKCSVCEDCKYCSLCPGMLYSENKTVKDFTQSILCEETQKFKTAFIE